MSTEYIQLTGRSCAANIRATVLDLGLRAVRGARRLRPQSFSVDAESEEGETTIGEDARCARSRYMVGLYLRPEVWDSPASLVEKGSCSFVSLASVR